MLIELLSLCAIGNFGKSLESDSKGSMKCISLNNQQYQVSPTFVNVNSDGTIFYLFVVSVNKGVASYNIIDDPYAPVSGPNKINKYWCKRM